MRIAICDDSAIDRELIMDMLKQYFAKKPIRCEFTPYSCGTLLLCDMEEGKWYDLIFLDIMMGDLLGIEVAHRLRNLPYNGEIVFLTASSDYAVDSYDVNAAGYILKPHDFRKLCAVMDRITSRYHADTYQLRHRSRVIRIPTHEILYVESSNSKCLLHGIDGCRHVLYKRLSEIERELNDSRFLRCHQSYLVNMDYISQADKQFILTSGDIVLIRQRDLKAIRQKYLDYLSDKKKGQ